MRRTGLRAGACVETLFLSRTPGNGNVAPAFGLVRVLKHYLPGGQRQRDLVAPAFGLVRVLKPRTSGARRDGWRVAPAFGLVRVLKLGDDAPEPGGGSSHRPSGWCVC